MKQALLALILGIALAGCASAYKPSGEMTRLKAGMDNNQARQVFHKNLLPSKTAAGICDTTFSRQEGKPPRLTASGYAVEAWRKGELIKTERDSKTGITTRYYKKVFYTQELQFADITKIRINRIKNKDQLCGKGDYVVTLHEGVGRLVGIVVSSQELDAFLAAVSTLVPNAKLIEGVGL